jgi:bifunctional DNase/RNase
MNTLVKAEIWTIARTDQGNAVLIRPIGAEIAVPIFIGQLETQSILIGFGDVSIPRPLTHDLILSLLDRLGAELLRIEINDLKDGTFYARLVLKEKNTARNEEFTMDARPSDALALAVRKKCPVYIAENVVEAAGVAVNLIVEAATLDESTENQPIDEQGASVKPSEPRTSKNIQQEILQAELDRAVAAEEYERAAEIRDLLAGLNNPEDTPPPKKPN